MSDPALTNPRNVPAVGGYADFLKRKSRLALSVGVEADRTDLHPLLYEWQAESVLWALGKGRCALFWDCGLGKTFAQVEWARLSAETSLIVAPLSVARQTVREARKLDVEVRYVRDGTEVSGPGLWITNYEMADRFDPAMFGALVLDESSILKNVDGKTRRALTERFSVVPRRLACTATPAPNDVAELTNHAEFLGVMSRAEMLASYFVNDEKEWRLKGHAVGPMFEWMGSWAQAVRRPSDLGYPDDGWELPPLTITPELVTADIEREGQLFATDLGGVGGRAAVRRQTMDARVQRAVELVYGSERIQSPLERSESGACPRVPAQDGGDAERAAAGAVRERPRASQGGDSGRSGSAQGEPSTPPSEALRTHGAPVGDPALSGVRDLRGLAVEDAHRPLPQDGDRSGSALPVVQPRGGAHAGRPAESAVDGSVSDDSAWIIWCGLNAEQDALAEAFGDDAISIHGSLAPEEKESRLLAWLDGERPVLLSKPAICGFGLNLQRAHRMVFVGLGDSYESYYQAIRRCWRFGQTEPVTAHVVVSHLEEQIVGNVQRKERDATRMVAQLVNNAKAAA